ncbi:MAG: class I SAM-dependent methyltransferase [Maribacter sp.]
MNDSRIKDIPAIHRELESKSKEISFTMPSDLYIGSLLKTLVSSKPNGHFLELGTGIGLSLSWMIDGMNESSTLISVDNDEALVAIANNYFCHDERVNIICQDGADWIHQNTEESFDLIFADAWPGKYSEIENVLSMLKVGGLYIIDDMNAQPNWPQGHEIHVNKLVDYLEQREDFVLTKMNWSTGLIIATKKHDA